MNEFPKNWLTVALSDIAKVEMGQSPDSRSYNNIGKGLPFFQGKAEFGNLYPTVRKWCTEPKKIAEAGDILLSVRAPVGPTNLTTVRCCIGRGLAAIRAETPINQKYLLHHFRNIEPWLSQEGTGTTFKAISGAFIRNLEVPLAPLPEQKRIADKLDSLLARVEACESHLERIPKILKRFRQSVLAAATSGELLKKEFAENNEILPTEWRWVTINDIAQPERPISYGILKPGNYYLDGIPMLRIVDIKGGVINLNKVHKVSQELSNEYKRTLLQGGECVISLVGTIGLSAYVPENLKGANVHRNLGVIAPSKQIIGKYLEICLKSELVQSQIREFTTGANQPLFNLGDLKQVRIPQPPLEEQAEIVQRVKRLFAYAERIEAHYLSVSERVERLTPSLLAKAFRGELVEQDAGDESAAVLLERIKTARSRQGEIRNLRGKLNWEGDLDEQRKSRFTAK